jgi:alginate O-acetyltransferase complex protein AlgI
VTIVSPAFAAFVVVALLVHHALPPRARTAWLLAVSYGFHALWAWQFVPLLAAVTVATFVLGARVARPGAARTTWLCVGIALNLGALAAFRLLFRTAPFAAPFVAVGLSFYSLQAVSYLIDVFNGSLAQRPTLAELALYLGWFPKLIAGPIERARTFLPRLAAPHAVDDAVLARAATLVAIGVSRKVVIADPLAATLPADVFTAPAAHGALVLAAALVAYAFVLYNDFAGYTSIVRGVSSLFGIELSPNFAQPFFARSFAEFWNRWHISLSHWVRDYVYLPLSRALLRRDPRMRNGANLVLPPLLAMLASALWHGAGLHMLLWGALHGVFLIGERLLALGRPLATRRRDPAWRQVASACAVFGLGTWAFAAFRMETGVALAYWRDILRGTAGAWPDPRLVPFLATSLWIDWIQYRHDDEAAFLRWPPLRRAALLAVAVVLWVVLSDRHATVPFIYQGF